MTTFAKQWQSRQLEIEATRILEADKRKQAKLKPKKKNQQKRLWPDQKKQFQLKQKNTKSFGTTHSKPVKDCDCNVEPWEDCQHTEREANSAMLEMLK